jgi:hypothetical protein
MNHMIDGPSAGYRQTFNGTGRVYTVLQSNVTNYVNDNYGDESLKLDTRKCSHVFFNFGQWPLSHAEPKPWTAQQYAARVAQLAAVMKQQQQQYGNRQYRVTTMPHPVVDIQQRKTAHHGVDHRSDPFIMLFNKVASTVMQARGIPVVELYSIAAPLFDMSYDSAHYIGTVGLACAKMVASIVCSDVL